MIKEKLEKFTRLSDHLHVIAEGGDVVLVFSKEPVIFTTQEKFLEFAETAPKESLTYAVLSLGKALETGSALFDASKAIDSSLVSRFGG